MTAPYVYLLASQKNGTLYIGVTSNLIQRIWQHREGLAEGFTKNTPLKPWLGMNINHATMESDCREKALKKWNRAWKLKLIEEANPQWLNLWPGINEETEL